MKKRFSEEQIIKILKEHKAGKKATDLIREHTTSASRPFTAGKAITAAWKSVRQKD